MKQTAVSYLQHEILNDRIIKAKSIKEWNNVISKAKEMEKQMIIDIVEKSRATGLTAEYLLLTYGSKGSDEIEKSEKPINLTSSQTEISDEEIERKISELHPFEFESHEVAFYEGCKWYREQLKSRQ